MASFLTLRILYKLTECFSAMSLSFAPFNMSLITLCIRGVKSLCIAILPCCKSPRGDCDRHTRGSDRRTHLLAFWVLIVARLCDAMHRIEPVSAHLAPRHREI